MRLAFFIQPIHYPGNFSGKRLPFTFPSSFKSLLGDADVSTQNNACAESRYQGSSSGKWVENAHSPSTA
jgi:hypothetical protein